MDLIRLITDYKSFTLVETKYYEIIWFDTASSYFLFWVSHRLYTYIYIHICTSIHTRLPHVFYIDKFKPITIIFHPYWAQLLIRAVHTWAIGFRSSAWPCSKTSLNGLCLEVNVFFDFVGTGCPAAKIGSGSPSWNRATSALEYVNKSVYLLELRNSYVTRMMTRIVIHEYATTMYDPDEILTSN